MRLMMWNGEEVAPTLTANNAGGGQRMPDKDNFNCVIVVYDSNADHGYRKFENDICETLPSAYGTGGGESTNRSNRRAK